MNRISSMLFYGIRYTQTGQSSPEKVLSGKQKNALSEDMRPFTDEYMGLAAFLNAAILRRIDDEGSSL